MTWSEVAVVVVAVLLLLVWWVWVAASRLDRLHRKVATSGAALDNQLLRRASAAAELAASGVLDPASAVLVADAAWSVVSAERYGADRLAVGVPGLDDRPGEVAALDVDPAGDGAVHDDARAAVDRELAESELSRTLRTALADPEEVAALRAEPIGEELLETLAAAWYRVHLARRFHNEAVAQTQRVRRKALVRLLRLHGHAPMPRTVEIDDGWPDALPRPGDGPRA